MIPPRRLQILWALFLSNYFFLNSFSFAQESSLPGQSSYSESKENVNLKVDLQSFSAEEFSLLLNAKPNSSRIEKIYLKCASGKQYKPTKTLRGTQIHKEAANASSETLKHLAVSFAVVAATQRADKNEQMCLLTEEHAEKKRMW